MNFRKITFLICFSFFAIISVGQNNYEEVVYLKNGSVIHGVIIEQIPNISIKIKTNDGNIFVFKIDEVEKITKELPVTPQKVNNKKSASNQKSKGDLLFGIKTGINLTDFTNNSGAYEEQLIPRFQASLVLRKCITNVVSFQPELQYSRQGFLLKGNNSSFNFVSEYLNLSPLFRFDLGKNQTKFILMVGPYLGNWINGKYEISDDNEKINVWISDWSSFNRIEIGGSVGFGISHSFANNDQIVLDSKLSYGFSGVLKNVDASNNSNNLYNSFSIGYLHCF